MQCKSKIYLAKPKTRPVLVEQCNDRGGKYNKGKKVTGANVIVRKVEQCDVLSGIAQANAGVCIKQLLLGYLKESITSTMKLFGGQALRNIVAAMRDKKDVPTEEQPYDE